MVAGCAQDGSFLDEEDGLSVGQSPYVTGTSMEWIVEGHGDASEWTVTSSDERVVKIRGFDDTDKSGMTIMARASRAGSATVTVWNGDEVVVEGEVDVWDPTDCGITSTASYLVPGVPPVGEVPRVLVGGVAQFRVEYRHGSRPLRSRDVLGLATDSDAVTIAADSEVRLDASAPGEHGFAVLDAYRAVLCVVEMKAVSLEGVARMELYGDEESSAVLDDKLHVVALGVHEDGGPIFGLGDASWTVEATSGVVGSRGGDALSYRYDPAEPQVVQADLHHLTAAVQIHGPVEDFGSSSYTGCLSGNLAILLALPVFGWRRRPDHPTSERG